MPKSLSRSLIDALLPPGDLWKPEPGESMDQQIEGLADTSESIRVVLDSLKDVRNPYKTTVFEDLERNYGFLPNENVTLPIRQQRLARRVYQGDKVNSVDDLQSDLDNAGFDLQVHKNDPAIDPNILLTQQFNMTCGSDRAYCGFNDGVDILSFCGSLGGELLVNTEITFQTPGFEMLCGGSVAYCGFNDGVDTLSVSGYFTSFIKTPIEYPIPTDPNFWPKIFFVGGDATRDGSGYLTEIKAGSVDNNRVDELKALILADKTLGAWCGLIIQKV